jgi:hypothetical protein
MIRVWHGIAHKWSLCNFGRTLHQPPEKIIPANNSLVSRCNLAQKLLPEQDICTALLYTDAYKGSMKAQCLMGHPP